MPGPRSHLDGHGVLLLTATDLLGNHLEVGGEFGFKFLCLVLFLAVEIKAVDCCFSLLVDLEDLLANGVVGLHVGTDHLFGRVHERLHRLQVPVPRDHALHFLQLFKHLVHFFAQLVHLLLRYKPDVARVHL